MPLNSNQIQYIIGNGSIIDNMADLPALQPFAAQTVEFLDLVSKYLLKNEESKKYPDVITFAFWCRKASLISMQKHYQDLTNRLGRGTAFHIAPSNVAVNFAYSFAAGLLAGNHNIVRLPSKDFEQVRLISDAVEHVMKGSLKQDICFIKYGHDKEVTDYLSMNCDTRIIWGGDQTIAEIRRSPIKPRATEITFADRYSLCVIDSDEYLKSTDYKNIAQGFYNDTYLTDQNACTSPRIVVWLGSNSKEAQLIFWEELHNLVKEKYNLQPVQAINKYLNLCMQSVGNPTIKINGAKDNYIVRVKLSELSGTIMDYKGNSGYFMEYEAKSLNELLPLCTNECQTLSYYGIDDNKIREFIMAKRPKGIDRAVPIGKTMDFSLTWDGYDLIRSLSREINL